MIGGVAVAASIVCEPVAAVTMPKLGCGCPRIYNPSFGHTCVIHDSKGKRWDAYSFEEIAAIDRVKVDVQTSETEWSCYCSDCDKDPERDNIMPVGTKCVWEKTSYEYDEWECRCATSYRRDWIDNQTTDWIAMAAEDGADVA